MFHLLSNLIDARDARRAEQLRADYGRRRWLISWERRGARGWIARLSCPDLPVTVARCGRSRCRAASRADRALHLLLSDDDRSAIVPDPRSSTTPD